jgi:hypothetical protein
MPRNRITTLVLQDPEGSCREELKEDTEAMFIDPISKAGYIIQKVRPRNINKSPVILKVFLVIIVMSAKYFEKINFCRILI